MATYDLLTDFGVSPGGAPSVVPYWVLAVIPFKNRVTFDRSKLASLKAGNQSGSFSNLHQDSVAEDPTIIISSECVRLSTSSDKRSHLTSMSATILPARPLLTEVHGGDWVFAWIVNDKETRDSLIERLNKAEPCNEFMDGLKFIGRCNAPREQFQRTPEGQIATSYVLAATGFSEFDSQILYFPQMERLEIAAGDWMHKLALLINDLVADGQLDINKVVPKLLTRLLGLGPVQEALTRTPNNVYLVPQTAARLLGKNKSSLRGVFTYGDLLEAVYGIQQYSNGSTQDHRVFRPDVQGSGPLYFTGKPMLGKFLPFPTTFDKPIWNILGEYLNPAINEMYVTLRANGDGRVVPHFVLRQMPFTTPANKSKHGEAKFHDLPRWKVDETLIMRGDLGSNEAARFNFIWLGGVSPADPTTNPSAAFLLSPPIWDEEDIKRSGLRPYTMTVGCTPEDAQRGPKAWVQHTADFLMGQHLTWNGTLTMFGIQAPICIGDNCEYRGVVYHIEGVNHEAGVSPSGMRYFYTTVALSHGMSSEDTMKNAKALGVDKIDLAQYPSLAKKAGFEPTADHIEDPKENE
jgi:hypothetical protein